VGLDENSQKLLVTLMRQHLKAGGLIVAATHVPLGLKPQKNLHLNGKGQA
jgi:heme exporter protein A